MEIETYSNNLVVAPAIGNLVTYFSDERPVPYLAESWEKEGNKWIFNIREGLFCENGELITASGFAISISRSIRLYSQEFEHPVFKNLKGYKSLIKSGKNSFDGIYAVENKLIFDFKNPIRGGFLEHLTMAPFGYICSANYDGDTWVNPTKIISSGAYSLEEIVHHDSYKLSKRMGWPLNHQESPENVVILRSNLDAFRNYPGSKVIETSSATEDDLKTFGHIRQIPQNLIVIKLNPNRGPFQNIGNRQFFLQQFRKRLSNLSFDSNGIFKTERFFANDSSSLTTIPDAKEPKEKLTLNMKVMLKGPNTPNNINKDIVEQMAKDYGWEITIDSEPYQSFRETFQDPKYDLYVQAAEIGGGFEGWVIDMLFCSDVGDRWPDPSGRICKLTKEFDSTDMSIDLAAKKFQDYLIEDAALIPTFHRGGFYLFSDDLDVKSLSPIVTRIRFEEIRKRN